MTTRKDELLNIYSDMFKDAYGFRPRGECINNRHIDDADEEFILEYLAGLQVEVEATMEREAAAQAESVKEFEDEIESTIALGAGSRAAALRWIMDAEDEYDAEGLMYTKGIMGHLAEADYVREIRVAMAA